MKIFNKNKTHFVQKNEKGIYNLEFDTIENVQAKINHILGASDSNTRTADMTEPINKPSEATNKPLEICDKPLKTNT